MANSRYYSSIGQQTTLTSGVTNSGTSLVVAAVTGFPGSLPYTLAVDYGSATEELVEVTGVGGTTLTVTRAIDGTSASSHNPGAVVRHVSSARDFTDSRTHEASASGVHGATGAVVGTTDSQTLTNKTLTHALGSADNFKLYNKGAIGVTQVIGDSANPNPNRLEVLDTETALNVMLSVSAGGAIKSLSRTGDADNTYRGRWTDNNGTTDRFAILSGGTLTISPTATTTFVGVDLIAPDTSNAKRAIRVAASGGGTERFTVWNDGRVDIVGTAAASSQLDVTAAAAQSTDIMRVLNSAAATQFSIQSTGRMLANKAATIAQPGVLSGTVLQVGGSNVGYTGALTQWVSPANTVVGSVSESGVASFSSSVTAGGALTANGLLVANLGANVTGDLAVTGNITSNADVTTGVSAFTIAANFTLTAAEVRNRGQIITFYVEANYTGSTITSGATGNITDTNVGTLAAAFRPTQILTTNYNKSGVADGSAHLSSGGIVTLTSLSPGATIASGDSVRMYWTFVL